MFFFVFFFKQKTAYEMRISDWSSDVCSSDLSRFCEETERPAIPGARRYGGMTMGKGRLEAFSDGVIAIIITIMVLELKVPHGSSFASLHELWPTLLSYVLSFVYVGI